MPYNYLVFISLLIHNVYGHNTQFCQKLPNNFIINANSHNKTTRPTLNQCFTIEQCRLIIDTSDKYHIINFRNKSNNYQFLISSRLKHLINYNENNFSLVIISTFNNEILNTTEILTNKCYENKIIVKRDITDSYRSSSTIITFNSSSFIDYHYDKLLNYPLRLSVHFRTIGRMSNGVILSLTHRKSSTSIIPFIIIEHSNSKIELTILQLDERKILSTVTTIQCGKNINNDNWHWLQFEIDENGIFTIRVDDDTRTSQIPNYVILSWNLNALLVGDTRRLSSDIFQPFIGYMSELIFNDKYLFENLKKNQRAKYNYDSQHIVIGYRVAFFNLVTIDTQKSYIAFSERESQNQNHGKIDIYFLFRSYVPDGIILYRYAQGLNEYFAIGLRAGILALFIDFGFGKRQIVSDESTKLADGKWHEVRVTRIGIDKIELVVDNRVNRSTLSANGIRNAVSLQPVLYIGGIPNNNVINLTGSGLNPHGFQGCLASFIVDGRLLDYQRALVLSGQIKMNVCSENSSNLSPIEINDLNKLCYDFTCTHSGKCSISETNEPACDCIETGYAGERCDKLPRGFYFGKHHAIGSIDYVMSETRETEYDTITFGLQTLSLSAEIFRLESDLHLYSLEYEIIQRRSSIKLNLGEKQPIVYYGTAHITDGIYHAIKIVRRLSTIELYVDGIRIELEAGNKETHRIKQRAFLAQRRLRIGNFKNQSRWNGILAGFSFNRQTIFEDPPETILNYGDVEEVYPDKTTNLFHLIESYRTATAIVSSKMTTTIATTTANFTELTPKSILDNTSEIWQLNQTLSMENISIHLKSLEKSSHFFEGFSFEQPFQWIYKQFKYFSTTSLLIGSILSTCFLSFLCVIIIHIHCKNRQRKNQHSKKYTQTNGKKSYSQIRQYTIKSSDTHLSKFLNHFHRHQKKTSKIRLKAKGSASRLSSGDSYHLISSIQDNQKDKSTSSYKNSDCILNDHCCAPAILNEPISSSSIYHQVNRLITSTNDTSLPLMSVAKSLTSPPSTTGTLRSLKKKDFDNSSAQTYSAVYSCDLAENLDIDEEFLNQQRLSLKRRSILKLNKTLFQHYQITFLYMKNLIDSYAIQTNNQRTLLIATADENRIQLSHVRSGSFHSQLPVTSIGACHNILFSYNGHFLIGLFYEITSNVNPYAVRIWSTDDYSIRSNLHPIKCSIAEPSRHSSILYMAGKQKYGRGISLGLLDIDSCSLARELKSDPDTSIGDEIKRIILTKNESYALVACTEFASTFTCFVVFKLESQTPNHDDQLSSLAGSMNNCTMILTRFDSDPNFTFSIVDTNNNGDQYMLTLLRTNEIIIWQLNDGEIVFNYDFNYLLHDKNFNQITDCQMNENRLLVFVQQGFIFIWDISIPIGQFLLIANICDPMIYSISWLDHRHFLSIDHDSQRIRTWNIHRKEAIYEYFSQQGTIQTLKVHTIFKSRKEYFIVGMSLNERTLIMFEYSQTNNDNIDSSNDIVAC